MGGREGDTVKRSGLAWMLGLLLLSSVSVATADEPKPPTRLSRDLAELASPPSAFAVAAEAVPDSFSAWRPAVTGDWVTIDATAVGDPQVLEAELIALGARNTAIAGRLVSARLPIAAIPSLEGVVPLRFARRARAMTNVGQVTSQGDHVIRADTARDLFGLDGTGVMVGVLSDSFDCQDGAADDVLTGDLSPVTVWQDEPGCLSGTDEGRALLQIVHDVAPGASLAFATAFTGQAGFANNIRALRDAGAKVILDDVIYYAEPMFQDGVIAQAVDEVTASGVVYFSSAGNGARRAYDDAFVAGAPLEAGTFGPDFLGGTPHVFSGTTNVFQQVTAPGGAGFILVLQWDSPFLSSGGTGTTNDLDIYVIQFGQVVLFATTNNIDSGDPVEVLDVGCPFGTCVGTIMIVNRAGSNPGRFKYVLHNTSSSSRFSPALNSGTIYGHANAQGAMAVGAANYKTPTTLESFSSAGTTPVLFDIDGNMLPSADPRQFKPWIVAPDGVDTSFFPGSGDTDSTGFPNFFGTSPAAPHAAAVAALMLQALPSLTPAELGEALRDTAQNMGPAGFDNKSGFGLIRADSALNALHVFDITAGEPIGSPNPIIPSGLVSVSVSADDSFGHTLTYAWTSTCTGGLPPGSFDDASLPATTWTAPFNGTGLSKTCALKVTVTDGHGFTRTGTHTATVLSVPRITSVSPGVAPVGATVVISGMSLANASAVTFSGPVTVAPTTVTATSITVVVPTGARTGVFSVTTPVDVGASPTIFKVAPKITDFTPPAGVVGGSDDLVDVTGTILRRGVRHAHRQGRCDDGPARPDHREHADVPAVQGPARRRHREDRHHDRRWHRPQRADPPRAAATPGDQVCARHRAGRHDPHDHRDQPGHGDGGKVQRSGPRGPDAADPDIAAGGDPARRADRPREPHELRRHRREHRDLQGRAEDFGLHTVAAGERGGGSDDPVHVTGTNLRAAAGTPIVKVGAMTVPPGLITESTPTFLRFKVPLGAVTAKIAITTVDGTALSGPTLPVQQPPRATKFAPATAPVGTTLTITGTNLHGARRGKVQRSGPRGPDAADPDIAAGGDPARRADRPREPHELRRHRREHRDLQGRAEDFGLHTVAAGERGGGAMTPST